ncbi:IS66 family insertion sequence element accessory protein TnpB [Ruficoccus amylovorans]|uniref:IS66 family insertion sequence element accessory protein TnpB n=1 Tax=Ruficoccus amylovorans TaxID=1804625 RepID=A0A842HAP3_9BACT|nr:IS66 family insertion sequence element accessory protein TnpB [Ruficoccus amylovorans]MBC2592654.1 IS66 family insertion sequence element accessory protein TnpB [Ruficoccus amylovorans]MBC2592711.1 IS66 family insertion sequence element accessory protein TnpB [Ruficoccus amylovorans]MBC2592733.1 IS66 family insertion sequence element accessory protein TnpB [Ruficoccus amylovorans]MBC2592738.1 IS66 family insertion sequence element accessory protein TnpB [Ruficoccus amylovorans]MBC2592745.1 
MLSLPHQLRVFVAVEPVDMRKQFDGLWAVARDHLGEDPKGGALFAFTNKTRNRLKLLYFDGTGVWVFAKRIEQGRLSWPIGSDTRKLTITPAAMTMLMNGIDLKQGTLKAWYER